MVLAALVITVLLGFAAFAVDIGYVTVQKTDLQNAADAAALAGVVEMPSNANAVSVAVSFAKANGMGVDANNVAKGTDKVVVTPLSGNRLQVVCTRNVDYFFAGVLGLESTTVTAKAVAEKYAQWAGEALPFINLDDDYGTNPEIVAWEKVSPGDFESINNYEIVNAGNPNTLYFKIDYMNGVVLKKGTVATIKQEVGYVYDQHKPDGHVYLISLNRNVINSGKVKLKNGTTKSLGNLKNGDVVDPSQLVLLECIFHDYDYKGKTLFLTKLKVYDIANGEFPPDYVGADGGTTKLVE